MIAIDATAAATADIDTSHASAVRVSDAASTASVAGVAGVARVLLGVHVESRGFHPQGRVVLGRIPSTRHPSSQEDEEHACLPALRMHTHTHIHIRARALSLSLFLSFFLCLSLSLSLSLSRSLPLSVRCARWV